MVALPISFRRGPLAGCICLCGPVGHGTSCHSVFGSADLKQPVLGGGVRCMLFCHTS